MLLTNESFSSNEVLRNDLCKPRRKNLTSRERIVAAIAHDNLMKHLNWKDQSNFIYDVFQQLAQPEEKLIGLLGGA